MFKRDGSDSKKKKVVQLFPGEQEEEFVCVLEIFRTWCTFPGKLKVIISGFKTPGDAWEYVQRQKELPQEMEIENAKVKLLGARACRKENLSNYVAADERHRCYNISEVA